MGSSSSAPKSGWWRYTTEDGRPYYFNHTTGKSSWRLPRRKDEKPWQQHQCELANQPYGPAKHVVGPK